MGQTISAASGLIDRLKRRRKRKKNSRENKNTSQFSGQPVKGSYEIRPGRPNNIAERRQPESDDDIFDYSTWIETEFRKEFWKISQQFDELQLKSNNIDVNRGFLNNANKKLPDGQPVKESYEIRPSRPHNIPERRLLDSGQPVKESYEIRPSSSNNIPERRLPESGQPVKESYENRPCRPKNIPERRLPEKGQEQVSTRPKNLPTSQTEKHNRLIDVLATESLIEGLVSTTKSEEMKVTQLICDLQVQVEGIYKVKNQFLEEMYKWKKEEYKSRFHCSPEEKLLIHATGRHKVNSIIKDNFDWRRVVRYKYGRGISFTDNADYANFYCNKYNGDARAFIICKVLICQSCEGNENIVLPKNVDTTIKKYNGQEIVFVKYNDNEFLPIYVVYYESSEEVLDDSRFNYFKSNRMRINNDCHY